MVKVTNGSVKENIKEYYRFVFRLYKSKLQVKYISIISNLVGKLNKQKY